MRLGKFEIRRVRKGNALHPDYKKLIEFAFDIDGMEYYAFKTLADMPSERYYKASEMITEVDMKITRESLGSYLTKIEELINEGNFGKVGAIVEEIKYRLSMLIETESLYRLASCVFFTLDEDITTYDLDYNDDKISKLKRKKISDFFLMEPVRRFIPLQGISQEDLILSLKLSEARKRYQEFLIK